MRDSDSIKDLYSGKEMYFPDKRFRPSSFLNRHPVGDITHSARRPEPDGSKIHPQENSMFNT